MKLMLFIFLAAAVYAASEARMDEIKEKMSDIKRRMDAMKAEKIQTRISSLKSKIDAMKERHAEFFEKHGKKISTAFEKTKCGSLLPGEDGQDCFERLDAFIDRQDIPEDEVNVRLADVYAEAPADKKERYCNGIVDLLSSLQAAFCDESGNLRERPMIAEHFPAEKVQSTIEQWDALKNEPDVEAFLTENKSQVDAGSKLLGKAMRRAVAKLGEQMQEKLDGQAK